MGPDSREKQLAPINKKEKRIQHQQPQLTKEEIQKEDQVLKKQREKEKDPAEERQGEESKGSKGLGKREKEVFFEVLDKYF